MIHTKLKASSTLSLLSVLALQSVNVMAASRTIDLFPEQSFEKAVEALQAGDTLIVHAGTYSGIERVSIKALGTETEPVIIRAAAGEARPLITRPANKKVQNTINIEGSSYLTIEGLEITGNGGDAIRVNEAISHHITLQNLLIHDVDAGINTKNNSHHFLMRNNHIYNTGIDQGTGEGFYIGCHNGSCSLSDSIIENNLIHDVLPGVTQGDGIEVKLNSENIIIRNNVIYNRPFPGIFVYGGGRSNLIEGNVVWNTLEGIAAISDALVQNNILFDNETGLVSFHHAAVDTVENTSFLHNTLYNNNLGALIRWEDASNMVFSNNAIYSADKIAVDSNTASNKVSTNIVFGELSDFSDFSDFPADTKRFIGARSAQLDFANISAHNFWPTASSTLVGRADTAFSTEKDFNDTLRTVPADIGAYQRTEEQNPGWEISADFKSGNPVSLFPPSTPTPPSSEPLQLALYQLRINHNWKTFPLINTNEIPVLISGTPSFNGPQPGVVRLRQSSSNKFDLKFKEYSYLDGIHLAEKIDVLAIKPGVQQLRDGSIVEAGWFNLQGIKQWQTINFEASFNGQPKVFLSIIQADSQQAILTRVQEVNPQSFQAALYKEESLQAIPASARVAYFAIYHPDDSGSVSVMNDANEQTVQFHLFSSEINHLFTQTGEHSIKLEEEQSRDQETSHLNEQVDQLTIGNALFTQIATANGKDTVSIRQR